MKNKHTNKRIEEAKAVIALFDQENKYYWIIRLDVCDAIKGFLINYFNV